ncbi:hypothetical protein ACOI1H_13440 [Loktanella sp. DJP18]|uniref:hypothetical protein n=1 Tax=Loktanella sp. DJP18 TaxID=3409788 RepID=UPI003BB5DCA9
MVDAIASGFPDAKAIDVLDVAIGMTFDETMALIAPDRPDIEDMPAAKEGITFTGRFPTRTGYEYAITSFEPGGETFDGFFTTFAGAPGVLRIVERTDYTLAGIDVLPTFGTEELMFGFGSAATGNRVQIIYRSIEFDTPVDKVKLLARLEAKYETPSAVTPGFPGTTILTIAYIGGSRIVKFPYDAYAPDCIENANTRERVRMNDDALYGRNTPEIYYSPDPDRKRSSFCSGAINIYLTSRNVRETEVSSMVIVIVDQDAIYQDQKAIDDVFNAAHAEFLNAPVTSEESKL